MKYNSYNKHSLRSNTKGYGGKTQWTDSQNSDTIAPSGKGLYHLQFSLQEARPETFGYTLPYRIHESLPLDPILSQMNPIHNFPFHFSKIKVKVKSKLSLCLIKYHAMKTYSGS